MNNEDRKQKLAQILSDDNIGLLDYPNENKNTQSPENSRLIDSFQEISDFFEDNHRLPEMGDDIGEYRLASRLAGIRNNPKKVRMLLPYDYYNLLNTEETKSVSLEEIISDDPMGLLEIDNDTDSIYLLTHVKPSDRLHPDYIARRKVCKDFDLYEKAFKQIHEELIAGKRRLVEFQEENLKEGLFYVLSGVMLLLDKNYAERKDINYKSGTRIRREGRTRCIFDNGTESHMLFRSLGKALKISGYAISDIIEPTKTDLRIDANDIQNGYVYVLRSLSRASEIRSIRNLYKIGCCSGDVTNRIRNSSREPTYLMSDVEVVLTVRCYNINEHNLEARIHSFFQDVNASFEVHDEFGTLHYPKEWFIAPLNIIEKAIPIILNDECNKYKYDKNIGEIIQKTFNKIENYEKHDL